MEDDSEEFIKNVAETDQMVRPIKDKSRRKTDHGAPILLKDEQVQWQKGSYPEA